MKWLSTLKTMWTCIVHLLCKYLHNACCINVSLVGRCSLWDGSYTTSLAARSCSDFSMYSATYKKQTHVGTSHDLSMLHLHQKSVRCGEQEQQLAKKLISAHPTKNGSTIVGTLCAEWLPNAHMAQKPTICILSISVGDRTLKTWVYTASKI